MKPLPYERYSTAEGWIAHTLFIKIHIVLAAMFVCGFFAMIISAVKSLLTGHRLLYFSLTGTLIGICVGAAIAIAIIETSIIMHKSECTPNCGKEQLS